MNFATLAKILRNFTLVVKFLRDFSEISWRVAKMLVLCIFDLQSFPFPEMHQFPVKMKTKALGIKMNQNQTKTKQI